MKIIRIPRTIRGIPKQLAETLKTIIVLLHTNFSINYAKDHQYQQQEYHELHVKFQLNIVYLVMMMIYQARII